MKANAVDYLDSLFKSIGPDKKQTKQKPPEVSQRPLTTPLPTLDDDARINNAYLYAPLGAEFTSTRAKGGSEEIRESGTEILRSIVKDNEKFKDKIENKNFLIEKYVKKLDYRKLDRKNKKSSTFRQKIENQLKFFKNQTNINNYNMYLPLNALWNSYIKDYLADTRNDNSLFEKVLKADFHGAILKVVKAKCKTYEGQSGIILEEKQRAFVIVTMENKISIILKKNAIFLMDVLDKTMKIYGCNLLYRPTDRLKERFKMKQAGDFILDSDENWKAKKKVKK